jgi:hypothetical protein
MQARIDAPIASACHGFLRRTTPLTQRRSMAFPQLQLWLPLVQTGRSVQRADGKSFQPSPTSALFAIALQCQ